ncbi:MAG: hypothetical protein FWH24_06510, partial [Oscillospiraceae bacterium]|nr:hypothetical protein [Oscillospiraceae bacterium]
YAIDAGLAGVVESVTVDAGRYKYKQITRAEHYEMPTYIHELSVKSISQARPVTIESFDAWRNAELSEGMKNNIHAQNLRRYCTEAGFTPLASEWWHFNDLHTRFALTRQSSGSFEIKEILSVPQK